MCRAGILNIVKRRLDWCEEPVPEPPVATPRAAKKAPPDTAYAEIDGVLRAKDEESKAYARFLSSIRMAFSNPWYLWEKCKTGYSGYAQFWATDSVENKVDARGCVGNLGSGSCVAAVVLRRCIVGWML